MEMAIIEGKRFSKWTAGELRELKAACDYQEQSVPCQGWLSDVYEAMVALKKGRVTVDDDQIDNWLNAWDAYRFNFPNAE